MQTARLTLPVITLLLLMLLPEPGNLFRIVLKLLTLTQPAVLLTHCLLSIQPVRMLWLAPSDLHLQQPALDCLQLQGNNFLIIPIRYS